MEWTQLWAGVTFTAQNGDAEGLLTAAAAGRLHLSDIVPRPGGFSARCAAWHYRKLAALARRRRVRLRIQKRQGLFFCIRPLLRRRGLWAGCLVFLPLLLWLQGFVWFVEPVGLTPGQQARAAVVLWEAGLFPGNAVTQEKLTAGEYALLQSGEFSWASLNFMKGKLVAEAAAAKPVPDIAAGTLHGLRARVSGRSSSGKTSRTLPFFCPSNSSQGSRPCIGRSSGTVMLSLCPPCILLRARQRPQPSSDTTSQKPSDSLFLFLSKKRHIITKLPLIWSGPKSRLWPLQGCKVNKLYSKIGLILSFWPAKRTSLSKKTPSTIGSSTPSPPTSANENAAQP